MLEIFFVVGVTLGLLIAAAQFAERLMFDVIAEIVTNADYMEFPERPLEALSTEDAGEKASHLPMAS